jgi:hypothetical protein
VRAISIIVLWLTAAALALTVYTYGLVGHYWYANDQGRGYDLTRWRGDSLDGIPPYPDGYRFRYSDSRFEKAPEIRTVFIILVLASASAGTIILLKRMRKQKLPKT